MLIVVQKVFSLSFVNKWIQDAPSSTWRNGVPPKPINKNLLKGAKSKRPKANGKMRQTAHSMVTFALAR